MISKKAKNFIAKMNKLSTLLSAYHKEYYQDSFETQTFRVRSYQLIFKPSVIYIQRLNQQTQIYSTVLGFSITGQTLFSSSIQSSMCTFNTNWDYTKSKDKSLELFEDEDNEFQLSTLYSQNDMFRYFCEYYMHLCEMDSFFSYGTDLRLFSRLEKVIADLPKYKVTRRWIS